MVGSRANGKNYDDRITNLLLRLHGNVFACIRNFLAAFAPSVYTKTPKMIRKTASKVEHFENAAVLQPCKQTKTERFGNDSF